MPPPGEEEEESAHFAAHFVSDANFHFHFAHFHFAHFAYFTRASGPATASPPPTSSKKG